MATVAACVAIAALLPGQALAKKKSDEASCAEAYNKALRLEEGAQLRAARKSFLTCAKPSCGDFLERACTTRFTRLDYDVPSVVAVVVDQKGAPLVDVQVEMDGEVLTSHLDGHAVPIDPGLHEFSFRAPGGAVVTQRLLILQGQRNRTIAVSLSISAAAVQPGTSSNVEAPRKVSPDFEALGLITNLDETPPSSGPSDLTYLLAGTGLASIGAGALLIYWGRTDNRLLAQCSPGCKPESVDHVRHLYIAANVALGAGVVALVSSFWLYTATRTPDESPSEPGYNFAVEPTKSGAVATVSGTF